MDELTVTRIKSSGQNHTSYKIVWYNVQFHTYFISTNGIWELMPTNGSTHLETSKLSSEIHFPCECFINSSPEKPTAFPVLFSRYVIHLWEATGTVAEEHRWGLSRGSLNHKDLASDHRSARALWTSLSTYVLILNQKIPVPTSEGYCENSRRKYVHV